jgi:SAM-dependent methyltransferase
MIDIFRITERPILARAVDLALAVRAVPFIGGRFVCPCCGWRLRAFTMGGFSLRTRHHGYCPRCNAKARHRRVWLYLQERTNLFSQNLRLFHVAPKYSLSRRLARMPHIDYVSADITNRPNTVLTMDLATVPLRSSKFDAVICIHVLEHIDDDRSAIAEMYRILRPGGWALISVPIRLDQRTYEDASIVSPAAREAAFGETSHVRYYGYDLSDRLATVGFEVSIDRASDLDEPTRRRYGLLDDENIFLCRKPAEVVAP